MRMNDIDMRQDFREIVLSQQIEDEYGEWEGNILDYLQLISENPKIASFASDRVYNAVVEKGTRAVDETEKTRDYEDLVDYPFFDDIIYGSLEQKHDVVKFLKAAARRTETGKRILMLMGPVSSGKSTLVAALKRGLEQSTLPKFTVKECPVHEEPLNFIPMKDRPFWSEKLNVTIEGWPCPHCQWVLDNHYKEKGNYRWYDVPVKRMDFSENRRLGIGTFAPSDPKSQDVGELIGRINMAKMHRHEETDPRAYSFDGEIQVANGGIIEMIELLKVDTKLQYVLIPLAQEQVIKATGFPLMYIDTLIIGHTNQTEFDKWRAQKENEALHSRMYVIKWPYNLKVDDEIKIYEKMIRESNFRDVHIAPHTLRVAAEFAVLSRLQESKKVSNLIQKMKLYNGESVEEFKKSDIDVKALREEGKQQGEGMTGISPRFVIDALNIALGKKEDKKCVNAIDAIRQLRDAFAHHVGIADEDIDTYMNLLVGEKNSISAEFKEVAKKEVNMAFLYAYEEQAQALFERYMVNARAFSKNEKVLDTITGEYSDPDEKLMRSIEELVPVPVNAKKEFRNNVFVHKVEFLERGKDFTYKDYDPLRDAIEKKLMSDLKSVVNLSIADTTTTDPKAEKRREKAFQNLMDKGFCEECANTYLRFVGEVLRKES